MTLSDSEEYIVEKILSMLADERILCEVVSSTPHDLSLGGRLKISPTKRKVSLDGNDISLTTQEFDLLYFLASQEGRVFTIRQIYEGITNEPFVVTYKSLESCLYRLRKKIGTGLILNVRGYGYKFQMKSN